MLKSEKCKDKYTAVFLYTRQLVNFLDISLRCCKQKASHAIYNLIVMSHLWDQNSVRQLVAIAPHHHADLQKHLKLAKWLSLSDLKLFIRIVPLWMQFFSQKNVAKILSLLLQFGNLKKHFKKSYVYFTFDQILNCTYKIFFFLPSSTMGFKKWVLKKPRKESVWIISEILKTQWECSELKEKEELTVSELHSLVESLGCQV